MELERLRYQEAVTRVVLRLANRKQRNRQQERAMNNKFDELTKSMAQSITRRAALKRFGIGLAGIAAACFGLANKAEAQSACFPDGWGCTQDSDCCSDHCKPK